ncbi:MAG TPA: hypothetical protein VGV60_10140 [Candidatus Polarisedimenticolia bacterium]|nr:hypothetical protein [Candidatus Polarisedimenticolia bacterium]
MNRRPPGATPGHHAPTGRPGLEPADPLPGWKAIVQSLMLIGIPLALLLIAKFVLKTYYPELGY